MILNEESKEVKIKAQPYLSYYCLFYNCENFDIGLI